MQARTIRQITAATEDKPTYVGVKVGALCVQAGVPITFIMSVMGSNPVSVRRWLLGKTAPRHKADLRKLARLVYTLEQAISQGALPSDDEFTPEMVFPFWQASLTAL